METTQTIKFLEAYTVKDNTGTTFAKDQVVTLSPRSAQHFLNRHVAVKCEAPSVPKKEPVEPKKPFKGK